MENEINKLTEAQCTALQQFIHGGDRGQAGIFVGRQAELAVIRDRLDWLLARQREGRHAPGADLTTVIQGAPGAGKSAFLEKVEETWPINEQGRAVAVSLDPEVLTRPVPDFLAAVASKVEKVPGLVPVLLHHVRLKSITVGGVVSLELDPAPPSSQPLVPVILLFDEIQTELLLHSTTESRGHLTRNLRLLHTGRHGAPMFPIYGGLANSADLLRSTGLTQLTSGSEWTLAGFSEEEMDELIARFVKVHLSPAQPPPSTLDRWRDALHRDSQGWPMHARNFLIALSEEIKTKDYRPAAVDLETVRRQARQLRFRYYAQRLQGSLEERYVLVSTVLEALHQGTPKRRGQVVAWIARAHQDCRPEDSAWGGLPDGMSADQAFDVMLHAGIVQKVDEDDYACPIRSLTDYMAAKATLPPSPLHEVVLKAKPEAIGPIMDQCRDDEERAKRLQATDIRGRTPLMLAVELGLGPLVKHLVELENRLSAKRRSVELRDHAIASGDERLVAQLSRLQPLASGHAR